MVSSTPLGRGLGPLETIVNVGWGSLPTYVSVYAVADRTGLGGSTPHVMSAALTAFAISKGCTEVLNVGGTFGSPYNAYFKLVVFKVPHLVKGELFTMTTSGTTQTIDEPAPDYFCGHYSQTVTVTDTGLTDEGQNPFGPPGEHIFMHHWHIKYETVTPDGDDVLEYDISFNEAGLIAGGVDPTHGPPGYPPNGVNTLFDYEALSYYQAGHLVNTGQPCVDPPTSKLEIWPFNPVQVVINPQKNHTVADPGVAFFYDPAQAVKVTGSGAYAGARTSLWDMSLSDKASPTALSGVLDYTVRFSMQNQFFSQVRPEKILEIWPSSKPSVGYHYDAGFRLNNFTKFPPPTNAYYAAWDGGYHGEFAAIPLVGGASPPPVTFDPFLYPL